MGCICSKEIPHASSSSTTELESLRAIVARYKAINLLPDKSALVVDCSVTTETEVTPADRMDASLRDLISIANKLISIKPNLTDSDRPFDGSVRDAQEVYERAVEIVSELAEEKEEMQRKIASELLRIREVLREKGAECPKEVMSGEDFEKLSKAIRKMQETYERVYTTLSRDFLSLQASSTATTAALSHLQSSIISLSCDSPLPASEALSSSPDLKSTYIALQSAQAASQHWKSQCSQLQDKVTQMSEDIDIKRMLLLHIKEEYEKAEKENEELRTENAKLRVTRSKDEVAQQIDQCERTIEVLKGTIGSLQEDLKAKDRVIEAGERRYMQLEETLKDSHEHLNLPNDFSLRMTSLQSRIQEYYSSYSLDSSSESD